MIEFLLALVGGDFPLVCRGCGCVAATAPHTPKFTLPYAARLPSRFLHLQPPCVDQFDYPAFFVFLYVSMALCHTWIHVHVDPFVMARWVYVGLLPRSGGVYSPP